MEGIIYKATNKINGKMYIGETVQTLSKRKGSHLYEAFKGQKQVNSKLYKALRKYTKDNFEWSTIEIIEADTYEQLKMQLLKRETYYIELLGTVNNGYNIIASTLFGNGALRGPNHSNYVEINIDLKEYIKIASTGINRKEIAEYFNITENRLKIWRKRKLEEDPIKFKQLFENFDAKRKKKSSSKRLISNVLSKEIIDQIILMRDNGKSIQNTHKELNLPFKTVRHVREQVGI